MCLMESGSHCSSLPAVCCAYLSIVMKKKPERRKWNTSKTFPELPKKTFKDNFAISFRRIHSSLSHLPPLRLRPHLAAPGRLLQGRAGGVRQEAEKTSRSPAEKRRRIEWRKRAPWP